MAAETQVPPDSPHNPHSVLRRRPGARIGCDVPAHAIGATATGCVPCDFVDGHPRQATSTIDVTTRPRAAISWSGGKDSCAALQRARDAFDVVAMVTMFDEDAARSRSHGLRPEVLAAQAERLGLRQVIGRCTWATYDACFSQALAKLAADGITHVIFGDILFDEHRRWAERMCEPPA